MKKVMKARKSGFTLVELLIVIMIIAILAGMMMLATGSATDSATATKIINDLRATKSAALLVYMDNNQSWDWAAAGQESEAGKSLDKYMDRPLFDGTNNQYELKFATVKINNEDRILVGFNFGSGQQGGGTATSKLSQGVKDKLKANAERSGLYSGSNGNTYDGGDEVYSILK